MTKQEFIEKTKEVWAPHFGEHARRAAELLMEHLKPSPQYAPLVAGLAALLAKQANTQPLKVSPISPESLARSFAIAEWARPWVEAIRQALFKTTAPPFAELLEATTWIEKESDRYRRQAKTQAARLVAWQQQSNNTAEGLAQFGYLPSVTVSRFTVSYPKDGVIVAVPANSPQLQRLAREAAALAKATGWGEVQTVLYLLVAHFEPVIPRLTMQLSLKSDKNPRGQWCSRRVADLRLISSDLSFTELHRVFTALRQKGVAKKKPVTKRAGAVWRFVQERRPPMTWLQLLEQWNVAHKKSERYGTLRGFRKAWERVEESLGVG